LNRISLVKRDGTTLNGIDGTYREVTFGNTWEEGVTVPANSIVSSDLISFDLTPGEDVFLTFWVPLGYPTIYRVGGSTTQSWIIDGTDYTSQIDWEGLTITRERTYIYCAYGIEIGGSGPNLLWSAQAQNAGGSWANSGWSNNSYRVLIEGSKIATGGSNIVLKLLGRTSGEYKLNRVSLVARDGTTLNGIDGTFQQVTFGGSWDEGVTVPENTTISSDPVSFNLAPSEDVFLTFWGPAGYPTTYRTGGTVSQSWIVDGTDYSSTIDWEGLSISRERNYIYCAHSIEAMVSRSNLSLALISETPASFSLLQNYPNPFNPETNIQFQLPEAAEVQLKIYNLLGQEVRTLVNENHEAGFHTVYWDGKNNNGDLVASGVYVYVIRANQYTEVKKMMLMK